LHTGAFASPGSIEVGYALLVSISARRRAGEGEEDPPCPTCGATLKNTTISFGQPLVPDAIARAMRVVEQADILLTIGTSLQVYPVAGHG
jgi:NAD-dependent deacetylase